MEENSSMTIPVWKTTSPLKVIFYTEEFVLNHGLLLSSLVDLSYAVVSQFNQPIHLNR